MSDISFYCVSYDEEEFPTPEDIIAKFSDVHKEMGFAEDDYDALEASMNTMMVQTALHFKTQFKKINDKTYIFFPYDMDEEDAVKAFDGVG